MEWRSSRQVVRNVLTNGLHKQKPFQMANRIAPHSVDTVLRDLVLSLVYDIPPCARGRAQALGYVYSPFSETSEGYPSLITHNSIVLSVFLSLHHEIRLQLHPRPRAVTSRIATATAGESLHRIVLWPLGTLALTRMFGLRAATASILRRHRSSLSPRTVATT